MGTAWDFEGWGDARPLPHLISAPHHDAAAPPFVERIILSADRGSHGSLLVRNSFTLPHTSFLCADFFYLAEAPWANNTTAVTAYLTKLVTGIAALASKLAARGFPVVLVSNIMPIQDTPLMAVRLAPIPSRSPGVIYICEPCVPFTHTYSGSHIIYAGP